MPLPTSRCATTTPQQVPPYTPSRCIPPPHGMTHTHPIKMRHHQLNQDAPYTPHIWMHTTTPSGLPTPHQGHTTTFIRMPHTPYVRINYRRPIGFFVRPVRMSHRPIRLTCATWMRTAAQDQVLHARPTSGCRRRIVRSCTPRQDSMPPPRQVVRPTSGCTWLIGIALCARQDGMPPPLIGFLLRPTSGCAATALSSG
jgi:hypothetical protein